MSSSHLEEASAHSEEIRIDISSNDPPSYNEVMRTSHNDMPTAPLMEVMSESVIPFSNIFGVGSSIQFEYNSSSTNFSTRSFLIRDPDGSLLAEGNKNSQEIVVRKVSQLEMLKIVYTSVGKVNGHTVHKFRVIGTHGNLCTIKVATSSPPSSSLKIIRKNGSSLVVNSVNIGDYVVFRNKFMDDPLCHIQMPHVDSCDETEFNIKIVFYPRSGITEDEQLLCTAGAIAFKTMLKGYKELTRVRKTEINWRIPVCVMATVVIVLLFITGSLLVPRLKK